MKMSDVKKQEQKNTHSKTCWVSDEEYAFMSKHKVSFSKMVHSAILELMADVDKK